VLLAPCADGFGNRIQHRLGSTPAKTGRSVSYDIRARLPLVCALDCSGFHDCVDRAL
jgi:hypothetical protein